MKSSSRNIGDIGRAFSKFAKKSPGGRKVKPRGASMASAFHEKGAEHAEADFRKKIAVLCPVHSLDEKTLAQLYSILCLVTGTWLSAVGQPKVLPILRRLASSARFLEQLANGLAGVQTGIRQADEVEFAVRIRQALALNPGIGDYSRADEKLASFQQECSDMAQVLWVAFATLRDEGRWNSTGGRDQGSNQLVSFGGIERLFFLHHGIQPSIHVIRLFTHQRGGRKLLLRKRCR